MQRDQEKTNVTLWRNSWFQQFKKDLSLSFLHLFNTKKTHVDVIFLFFCFSFCVFHDHSRPWSVLSSVAVLKNKLRLIEEIQYFALI